MPLVCGLDCGQQVDHSALCAVDRVRLDVPVFRRWKHRYVIRLLTEYPLGVDYPTQVSRFCEQLSRPAFKGARVGVDYTGVGRPVFDMMRAAKPPVLLYAMLTTSGTAITFDERKREYHVPKFEQVSTLQCLLQAGLLIAHEKLPAADRLRDQLKRFKATLTRHKNATFGAESGTNDDLVSAVMTAVWLGEHTAPADPAGITVGGDSPEPESADRGVLASAPAGTFAQTHPHESHRSNR